MKPIKTLEIFHLNRDNSIKNITEKTFFSPDVLPNTLLIADRENSSLTAYSGVLILDKNEVPDIEKLLRLHDEYSVCRIDNRNGCIYLASLELDYMSLRTDTQQQYIMQISDYFAAFRMALATTLSGIRTRPLTVDELIARFTGL